MSYIEAKFTERIMTPDYIATGPAGEPGWIVVRTKIKNKHFMAFTRLARAISDVSLLIEDISLAQNGNGQDKAKQEALLVEARTMNNQIKVLEDEVYRSYCYIVADWNWSDFETGEPLPKPIDRSIFENELTQDQINWLKDEIDKLRRYRATEGNAPTSTP
jgi:hypothetical protein